MKDSEDAVGHHLLDYLQGGRDTQIVERDDGKLLGVHGAALYFTEFDEWAPHEQEAIRCVSGRVLDVGCGAGRHAIYLQDAGLDVTGIDVSPLAIAVCRKRGLKRAGVMSAARLASTLGKFDSIVMLDGNFGLLGDHHQARWLLRRLWNMTSREGRIITGTYDPSLQADASDCAYAQRNSERGNLPGLLRLRVRYRDYGTGWFDYLVASQSDMKAILSGTGWQVDRFIETGDRRYSAIIRKELAGA